MISDLLATVPAQPFLKFFVPGKPASAGSKKVFLNRNTGRPIVAPDDERSMPWRTNVQGHALQVMNAAGRSKVLTLPVLLMVEFWLQRPKAHFRTGKHAGELRADAPVFSTHKPDTDKLLRAVEDALTGLVWQDDAQVAVTVAAKTYADPNEPIGAHIEVSVIMPADAKLPSPLPESQP